MLCGITYVTKTNKKERYSSIIGLTNYRAYKKYYKYTKYNLMLKNTWLLN